MPPVGTAARRAETQRDSWADEAWTVPPERDADSVGGVPGRRTVTIRGYGAERYVEDVSAARRARAARRSRTARPRRPHERAGFRPDRVAMWAVLLGVLLVLVAATTSKAGPSRHSRTAHHVVLVRSVAVTPHGVR
jgi:hypothetical protein